jgi:hypothetical protein
MVTKILKMKEVKIETRDRLTHNPNSYNWCTSMVESLHLPMGQQGVWTQGWDHEPNASRPLQRHPHPTPGLVCGDLGSSKL